MDREGDVCFATRRFSVGVDDILCIITDASVGCHIRGIEHRRTLTASGHVDEDQAFYAGLTQFPDGAHIMFRPIFGGFVDFALRSGSGDAVPSVVFVTATIPFVGDVEDSAAYMAIQDILHPFPEIDGILQHCRIIHAGAVLRTGNSYHLIFLAIFDYTIKLTRTHRVTHPVVGRITVAYIKAHRVATPCRGRFGKILIEVCPRTVQTPHHELITVAVENARAVGVKSLREVDVDITGIFLSGNQLNRVEFAAAVVELDAVTVFLFFGFDYIGQRTCDVDIEIAAATVAHIHEIGLCSVAAVPLGAADLHRATRVDLKFIGIILKVERKCLRMNHNFIVPCRGLKAPSAGI